VIISNIFSEKSSNFFFEKNSWFFRKKVGSIE
jgi:hypothetical protein